MTDSITLTFDLHSGQHATAVVTRGPILVAVDDRACLAHHDWFNRAEAAEMIRMLSVFTGQVAE